jgi:protein CpxP
MVRKLLGIGIAAVAIFSLIAGGAIYTVNAANKEATRWENAVFPQDDDGVGHGPFKHRMVGRIMAHIANELKLTEPQKTEIHGILAAERQNVMPLLRELHENKKQHDASTGGNFDETQARAFAARQAQTITELIVAKERVKSKVLAVLTPEQRQKVNEMHNRFSSHVAAHLGAG